MSRIDCVFYSRSPSGFEKCSALTEVTCKRMNECPFYKDGFEYEIKPKYDIAGGNSSRLTQYLIKKER